MDQSPSAPQPTEPPPAQTSQPQTTTAISAVTSAAAPSLPPPAAATSFPNQNPTPSSKPPTPTQSQQSNSSQTRPFNTRPWQPPPYSHFSLPSPPMPASSASTSASISAPPPPRGGMAIGVPAHSPSTGAPPPASFSSLTPPSYGQQSQIRQPVQGIGMAGALGPTSSMRPAGVSPNQLRPSQSSLRPQSTPNTQSPAAQNFQGHGMLRVSSLGASGSPSPTSSHSSQLQNQPWLSSSATQGKPPLPTQSLRPQTNPQSFQQRSHIPHQLHHNTPTTPQQQSNNSSQQSPQPSASSQAQEHFNQQFPPPRSITHQMQMSKGPGIGTQRPPLGTTLSGASQPGALSKPAAADPEESSNRILSKRSIQELVNQIDPSEKLDPEVEDILVDIAEDFVESITTFGCSLAKHRKSSTLEAKDILLHLERNWNMALPGFGGEEIRMFKKPLVNEIHRERLAAVKKSMLAADTMSKNTSGAAGSARGHLAKGTANTISSPPNPKIREAA